MTITFRVLERGEWSVRSNSDSVQLVLSNWDDYSFKTSFEVVLYDAEGQRSDLGTVKIGYLGQAPWLDARTDTQTVREPAARLVLAWTGC